MPSITIKVDREGYMAQAHRTARPGATAGGTNIYEIANIPAGITVDQVIAAFRKFAAPTDRFKIDYVELTATAG